MLGGLSDAIKIAKKTRRHLVIECQSAGAFKSRFDKYFYIEDEDRSYSCSFEQLPDAAVYQGGPSRISKRFRSYGSRVTGIYSERKISRSFEIDWEGRVPQ